MTEVRNAKPVAVETAAVELTAVETAILRPNATLLKVALVAILGLISLCTAWELALAPLRPGGSWLVLKVVPLLFVLRGVLKADNYTLQWSTLLVWFYFTEGIVRAASDNGLSAQLALIELLLSIVYFLCTAFYLRPLKKLSKQKAKQT